MQWECDLIGPASAGQLQFIMSSGYQGGKEPPAYRETLKKHVYLDELWLQMAMHR